VKSAGAPIIAAYRHFFRGFDIKGTSNNDDFCVGSIVGAAQR
jgi:hypothetical protein